MNERSYIGHFSIDHVLVAESRTSTQLVKRTPFMDKGIRFAKAISIAVAVFVGASSVVCAAPLLEEIGAGFRYDFASETASFTSSHDPILDGITFSPLSLVGLRKGDTYQVSQGPNPPLEFTYFSGWERGSFPPGYKPLDSHLTFTIFAPAGYEMLASGHSFTIDPSTSVARYLFTNSSSGYAASQEVSAQVDIFTTPGSGGNTTVALGFLSGGLSIRPLAVPEPSPAGLVGMSVAGLALVVILRRSRRGDSSGVPI